jgi:hypothetical protein
MSSGKPPFVALAAWRPLLTPPASRKCHEREFVFMGDTMKLSDYLVGVGRPIAYYPGLRKLTGSTNATIFLCQFVYWTGKGDNDDGWIYKTSDEIEAETGLSYDEQKTARKKLTEAKLIEEKYARLEHQMYFRVNLNALNDGWAMLQNGIPEHGKAAFGKAALPDSLISNTENTTENTTPTPTPKKGDLVDGVLYFNAIAKERGEDKVEETLDSLEKGLRRGIKRSLEWQQLARWIIKKGNLAAWIEAYMADPFNVKTAWRLTPQKIMDSWDTLTYKEPEKKHRHFKTLPDGTEVEEWL